MTDDADRALAQIKAALDAGPTPGPWHAFHKHKYDEWHVSVPLSGQSMMLALFSDGCPTERPHADAQFIAACNPSNMAAILDALTRLRAELAHEEQQVADMMADVNLVGHDNDRLRAEIEAISAVIGTDRYLDPPDGGDVPLSEQVRRMRAENEALRAELAEKMGDSERLRLIGTRPPTPTGWSDTDWIKHLQKHEEPHPLAGQHINRGSMDSAADAYEAEYTEALKRDAARYRWLRGDGCRDHSARWTQWEVRCWRAPFWTTDLRRADLDSAIDAARKVEA